jgi:hypothetical protein
VIRGRKPNGYTVGFTQDGHKVEAETRACIHCGFNWSYGDPHFPEELDALLGHPTRRGWCFKCCGWLCGRRACLEQQVQLTGNTTDCMPYEEWCNRVMDKVGKYLPLSPELTITAGGLIVPR